MRVPLARILRMRITPSSQMPGHNRQEAHIQLFALSPGCELRRDCCLHIVQFCHILRTPSYLAALHDRDGQHNIHRQPQMSVMSRALTGSCLLTMQKGSEQHTV